jgi:hypothetical protein
MISPEEDTEIRTAMTRVPVGSRQRIWSEIWNNPAKYPMCNNRTPCRVLQMISAVMRRGEE